MPAGKFKVFDFAKKYLVDGTLDLDETTNWKMALYQSASNADTLSIGTGVLADLTLELANANGYTTSGNTLAAITVTRLAGTTTFDVGDPVWTAAGGSIAAKYAVIYKNATVNGIVKPLLCVCLLETAAGDVTATTGNTLTIVINAAGVISISGGDVN